MFYNRVFQITFLISVVTHTVILFQYSNPVSIRQAKEQKLEVSYLKNTEMQKITQKETIQKKEPLLKSASKISLKKIIPPPFIEKEGIFKKENKRLLSESSFVKPAMIRPDIIAVKKIITFPPVDPNKINNPSYLSYYQIVREKIRRNAYQNYARTDTGEVYLSFIITSSGELKEMRLGQDKSCPSEYLRSISLKSVGDASPFPNFPAELDYPQLSFNVIISFEIE